MSLSKESSSNTLPSQPTSPSQKPKASRYSKQYMWSLALFPKLLKVSCSKYFFVNRVFRPTDRSKQVGPRSSRHHLLATPLSNICNFSFSPSSVPDKLKISKVNPMHNSDDKTNFTNYRPISILTCFSKSNPIKPDILKNLQYGFGR